MPDILSSPSGAHVPHNTPWGPLQHEFCISAGVCLVETPSHGGLYLAGQPYDDLPDDVKDTFIAGSQWPEEDCEMVLALAILQTRLEHPQNRREFPQLFDSSGNQNPGILEQAVSVCQTYDRYLPCRKHLPA